ncbi:MAG: Uma2 family endonuclease [Synechococcales cyanobacterium RU_4_20]|nr:Uma2 family endonuclease [Synechococcales cyanobacterium RU_4_20]NJR67850.1 Uma2 family endonuclease [Synechococcales cyanobacterium CRU_2_2]
MIATPFYLSPEDYLEGERVSPIKHEYRRGHVYAMTGAKKPHVIITANLTRILGNHLEASPCIVMASDIKVRLQAADCYYYPDAVVTCHPEDLATTEDFIYYPKLVIEVLSKSTASFDRGEKFMDYQTCPTLEEYVLVSQTHSEVLHYVLRNGSWIQEESVDQQLHFSSIDCTCSFTDLYRKVPGLEPEPIDVIDD